MQPLRASPWPGAGVAGEWLASPVAWAAIVCAGTSGAALPKV